MYGLSEVSDALSFVSLSSPKSSNSSQLSYSRLESVSLFLYSEFDELFLDDSDNASTVIAAVAIPNPFRTFVAVGCFTGNSTTAFAPVRNAFFICSPIPIFSFGTVSVFGLSFELKQTEALSNPYFPQIQYHSFCHFLHQPSALSQVLVKKLFYMV